MADIINVQTTNPLVVVSGAGTQGPAGATGPTGPAGPAFTSQGLASLSYYGPVVATVSNFTMVLNTTYYTPIYVPESTTFDRIAIRSNTFTGTAAVRLGVYNNANGKPTTVAFDSGTVAVTAASTLYTITINQTLAAGWYWLASNSQTAAATNGFTGSTAFVSFGIGQYPANGAINFTAACWSQSGVSGAFATAGTVSDSNGAPIPVMRKA